MTTWMRDAACRDMDTNLFFPMRKSRSDYDESIARQTEYAKSVCAACPVIEQCRDYILSEDLRYENDFGIWGGMTPEERHKEHFERRMARQRELRRRRRFDTL